MSENLKESHWTREAKCNFDTRFLSFDLDEVEKMKSLCSSCPVKQECIKWTEEIDGHFVSAGTSRYDRKVLQWKRIDDVNESNFRGSDFLVSEVLRRIRTPIRS